MGADKATRAVLKDLAAEPALTRGSEDIDVVRATYDRVFSAWTAGAAVPTREDWIEIASEDHRTNALIVEPVQNSAVGSILFIHGGGWSLGSALCYAPLCRAIAAETGMRVIVPDFPQAPEHPFPAAYELLVTVTDWAQTQFEAPLFLAGDSAGGTLAAAISSDKRFAKAIRGQALFYPVLDLRPSARYRSRRRFGSGKYFLSEDGILGAASWYCGDANDPEDPRISPILSPKLDQTPPTFILLPDLDPLKDEGEKYAALLKKSGVAVEVFRARNTVHGCVSFSGRIPQGYEGIQRAGSFLTGFALD
ncbi:alpha/beta hydrolase [Hyphococcus sp. DH-69]|uniref:alpha/beta hydrolase n=1 Tax=Hyphococcus formosus TaxID=3143534 RepID=UPI00398B3681